MKWSNIQNSNFNIDPDEPTDIPELVEGIRRSSSKNIGSERT